MSGVRWRLAARVGTVLLLAAAPAGSDGDPEGYALRFPLSVEAGARLVEGRYLAETFPVSVEDRYVVVEV